MKIKELKKLLKDIPDAAEVKFSVSGTVMDKIDIVSDSWFSPESGFETETKKEKVEIDFDEEAKFDFIDVDKDVVIGLCL